MEDSQDKNSDKDYKEILEVTLEEIARDMGDCRLCDYYSFDRSVEVEFFNCNKGYFRFIDYGSFGGNEGEMRWFDCKGKDFVLNKSSRWWHCFEKEIIKEAKERLKMGDNISEDLSGWIVKPSSIEELLDTESIAAFSFGFGPQKRGGGGNQYDPSYFYPGKSNDAMANLISNFKAQNSKIGFENIFAQQEIADSLLENHGIQINSKHIAKPGENYLGTRGVSDMFFDRGLGNYSKIAIFAHPMHTYRCGKTLEKSAKDHNYDCKILIPDTSDVPFDELSVQPWTRNLKAWVSHEINSRAYAISKGNM